MTYEIHHANVKDWADTYDGEPFDAILCDPPYELGFMGKGWDRTGISNDAEMWAELLRICKPGAHLLAFSGSRTYHRMACAIEDAGFEIRDMIEWIYGSGFPKSLNVGKAVDKIQGNEREVVGEIRAGRTALGQNSGWNSHNNRTVMKSTRGASAWEGYGTALKPSHEPICVARKPIEGTVARNVLQYGIGGLNIDGCRVGSESVTINTWDDGAKPFGGGAGHAYSGRTVQGRWPANLIHDGSDEVLAGFPDAGDMSAARFFYCAKANKSERNAGAANDHPTVKHPTVKPLTLTKYLATLIKPPSGGRLLVPFSGSGSEVIGALQAGWEHVEGVELMEEYISIALARIAHWSAGEQPRP